MMASDSDLTYRDVFGEEVEWKPVAPVTFWLTRHGVSEYNLEDRIGGDSSITSDGQIYADTLPSLFGRVLLESGEDHRFISVWTSTLLRTIQTASKLPLPQIHLKELDEINAGVCDGATYEYIKRYMPYIHYNRKKDKLGYRYPSGESYIDLCKRVWPIVRQLKAHGGSKLIVGHQAVLRCIFGYLEGRPMKDITHLSVPHHYIFQFTVHPDGTIVRKDFPMELVRDCDNPHKPIPGWPFDVSHSRPLTATDIARYSPKPMAPLLIDRVASLSDAPPAASTTVDLNSQGVAPPALPPVLPDPATCAAAAVTADESGTSTAIVDLSRRRTAASSAGTNGPTAQQEAKANRVKAANSKLGRAVLQTGASRSTLCLRGQRSLLTCKSTTTTLPGAGAVRIQESGVPQRLQSAPGDILTLLDTYQHAAAPDVATDEDISTATGAIQGSTESVAEIGTVFAGSSRPAEAHEHSSQHAPNPCGGSPTPCSIPEKCRSLLAQTLPVSLSSDSNAATLAAAASRAAGVSSAAPQSKHQSPVRHSTDAPKQHMESSQCAPPEVRCLACGCMVPVHPRPCDIKPSRLDSGNVQNVLTSYLPDGITASMALSSSVNESCPGSKRASFNIESAFDFDDAMPQLAGPMPPGAYTLQSATSGAGKQVAPSTVAASNSGPVTPSIGATPAVASPATTSPVRATIATAQPAASGAVAPVPTTTPQLQLREVIAQSTSGGVSALLDLGSGDPSAEYPGSPCAPYPLIATPRNQRAMSELALAFQELRARGSCSNIGSGGAGSSHTDGAALGPRCGRLSLPRPGQPPHTSADSFVADDPCVRAEELRRKLEDSQGFHFRGDACRLVESSSLLDIQGAEEPSHENDMHQPADLAW